MIYLRQSTASQEVLLGPFLDDTDGKTAETGLTIANTDIKVWKRGGTTEASKNSGGATHIAAGRYYAVLDATDTDTIGELELNVHVSGALPVKLRATVLHANVFDVLFGSTAPSTYAGGDTSGTTTLLSRIGGAITITAGRVNADLTHIAAAAVSTSTAQLGVNVVQVSGDATAADNAEAFFDGTGYAGTNNVIPLVTTTTTATNVTTVNGLAANVITAASIAADAITGAKVASDVTIASVTGAVGSVTGNVGGNVAGSVGSVTARVTANTDQLAGQTVTAAAGVTFPSSVGTSTLTQAQVTGGAYSVQSASCVLGDARVANLDAAVTTRLAPTTAGRTLDVTATGAAGIDWGNVENATTTLGLTNTRVGTVTFCDYVEQVNDVAAVAALANDAITAAALAADAGAEIAAAVRTDLATELGRIDAAVTSRMATYTQPTGFLAATFPADPAGLAGLASAHGAGSWATATGFSTHTAADVVTALGTGTTLTSLATQASVTTIDDFLDTEVAAIKAKTDLIPAAPAATGDIPTAAAVAAAVLAAAAADPIAADVQEVNAVALTGDGTSGAPWGPA